MESNVIEIGLSILRISIKSSALDVKYLQKGIEKVSWQMRVVMIGHISAQD
jgi:hypothetical protein